MSESQILELVWVAVHLHMRGAGKRRPDHAQVFGWLHDVTAELGYQPAPYTGPRSKEYRCRR